MEFHPRIDEGNDDIREDVSHDHKKRGDGQCPHDEHLIGTGNGTKLQQAEPLNIENCFDQKAAGNDKGDQLAQAGGDWDEGIPKGMTKNGAIKAHPR